MRAVRGRVWAAREGAGVGVGVVGVGVARVRASGARATRGEPGVAREARRERARGTGGVVRSPGRDARGVVLVVLAVARRVCAGGVCAVGARVGVRRVGTRVRVRRVGARVRVHGVGVRRVRTGVRVCGVRRGRSGLSGLYGRGEETRGVLRARGARRVRVGRVRAGLVRVVRVRGVRPSVVRADGAGGVSMVRVRVRACGVGVVRVRASVVSMVRVRVGPRVRVMGVVRVVRVGVAGREARGGRAHGRECRGGRRGDAGLIGRRGSDGGGDGYGRGDVNMRLPLQ